MISQTHVHIRFAKSVSITLYFFKEISGAVCEESARRPFHVSDEGTAEPYNGTFFKIANNAKLTRNL